MENDFLKIMSYNVLLDFEKEGREPDFTIELAASITVSRYYWYARDCPENARGMPEQADRIYLLQG